MDQRQETPQQKRDGEVSSLKEDKLHLEALHMEDAQLPIPENLRSLSEVEVARLGRKAVFKLDCTLMPCLTTMFIMNYLDRQVSSTEDEPA